MIALSRFISRKLGVYDLLRSTQLFERIQRFRKPEYMAEKDAELEFYKGLFESQHLSLIFDIGANFGNKAAIFSKLADHVVCVEPDRRAVAALETRFRKKPNVHTVAAAMGAVGGQAEFMRLSEGSTRNTLSQKHAKLHQISDDSHEMVDVVTADALIDIHGVPNFLKVDVEGFEVDVFAGLTKPVPLISFEANLPEFRSETITVVERLLDIHPRYRFNAIRNDGRNTKAFDDWVPEDNIAKFIKSVDRDSYDIYAAVEL